MPSETVTSPLLSQAFAYLQEGDAGSADHLIRTFLERNPDHAQGHHIAGLCCHALGDGGGARHHLERAVALAPDDVGSVIQLAMLLTEQNECQAGLLAIDRVLETQTGNADLLQARSTLQRRAGDTNGAVATAQMAVAFAGRDARSHLALGMALAQARAFEAAQTAFQTAVELDPEFADAWTNLGVVAKENRDLDAAEESYRRALALQPDDPIVHNNFGNLLLARGDVAGAMKAYERAVTLKPDYIDAKVNFALSKREAGDAEAALHDLQKINTDHPNEISVLNSLGNALRHAEQFEEARDVLEDAVALSPDHAEAHNNLGLVMTLLGEREIARSLFARAVDLRPDLPVLANNYGTLLLKMFLLEEAIDALGKAVALDPSYGDAWVNLGVAHFMCGHYDDAIAAYRKVISQQPDNAFAHYSLGVALIEQQDLEEGSAEIQIALDLNPDNVMALNTLGVALLDQHRVEEAFQAMNKAAEAETLSAPVYASNALFTSLYLPEISNDDIFKAHCAFGERFTSNAQDLSRPHTHLRNPDRKLKLAYMSPDFRGHSVAFFMEALLEKHDRSAFEIILYSNTTRTDTVTEAMRNAADVWVETAGLTDAALVDRIRHDRVDILVDLGGHTSGNRLVVCGYKPAPIQIEYLGYPDTSGVAAMDYRLTDERADPSGDSDPRCTEALVRLPHCFHCYRPNSKAPDPAVAPHIENGYVTFGSFNVLPKLNDLVVEAWARILSKVPKSRLYLKCKQLKTEGVRERVLGYFAAQGIDRTRIQMESFVPSVQEHLNQYAKIDLALDTFPYNGTTTTCEAMWMGVPVLTIEGYRHTGRVGLSLLHAVGLHEEFVVSSVEDYVSKAIAMGRAPARLAELRTRLRDSVARSPLRDEIGFTRTLEETYRELWKAWCNGPDPTFENKPPEPLRTDDSVQSVLGKTL